MPDPAAPAARRTRGPALRSSPGVRSSTTWRLTFVPRGSETPKRLDSGLPTAEVGMKIAEAFNQLDWEPHEGLGHDALLALGRTGAFVLEPVTR